MRDPARIPLILAAVERAWKKDPDQRLGQLLTNSVGDLFAIEDGDLLEVLGPQTEEEKAYAEGEKEARAAGWEAWSRRMGFSSDS